MILRLFFFSFIFCTTSVTAQRINRYRHLERQGIWIIYTDSTHKQIDNIGRYRRGIPKGNWKYYDSTGNLTKTEKHIFKKIKTKFYYPNGIIAKKGNAKMVITDALMHYFYYGNWEVYDSLGEHSKTLVYKNGTKISETNYKTSSENEVNDSLVQIVRSLNTRLNQYSDSLSLAERIFGKNSKEYNRLVALSNLNAYKVLDDIDKIILRFGYPGKTLVGKEYAIIFSIISSATLPYKEKYYSIIIDAANTGELDWSDVAFFVDKVKIAKREKQTYGTQYKIENNEERFYPIEEPELLNSRRKKAGLEEMNLEKLKFLEY